MVTEAAARNARHPNSGEVLDMVFRVLGVVVTRHPWRVVGSWMLAFVVLVSVAPGLKTSGDQASFLPSKYESVRAQHVAERAFPGHAGTSGILVVRRADGLRMSPGDRRGVSALADELRRGRSSVVSGVTAPAGAVSHDGRTALIAVAFTKSAADKHVGDAVKALRRDARAAAARSHLTARMTGPAAQVVDIEKAGKDADGIVLLATGLLIFVLLTAIFRSVVTAFLPLLTIVVVSGVAMALIGIASKVFGLQADSSIASLLTVVLFGIGTDYIVFLLFRMRERLRAGDEPREAVRFAVRRVGATIASSAAVVMIAFLALLASELSSNRALAPSLVVAVAVMLLSAVTLVPAVLTLAGPRIFWPSRHWRDGRESRLAAAAARRIALRPGAVAATVVVVLLAMGAGILGFNANYDTSTNLPGNAESLRAQRDLAAAFPQLSANPTTVYVVAPHDAAAPARLAARLRRVPGVEGVSAPVAGRDRTVRLDVSLAAASATSNAALDLVKDHVRPVVHASAAGRDVVVGGTTAAFVDGRHAINRDYGVVLPLAAVIIMLIIAVLLRSLVAPVVLLAAVGLGFLATMGVTVGVFQGLAGKAGVAFSLPLTIYAFVVAIGTDYNILVAARLREEDTECSASSVERAVRASLPTITAAGIILAGTFASLMLTPGDSQKQLGFAVSAGILISAFLMAGTLVPSLARWLGRRLWWPGRLAASGPAATEPGAVKATDPAVPSRQTV
jgi:RND superfamily putative drug exporter